MKPIEILREKCRAAIGESFNEDTFQKAIAKAKRWATAAYGNADLQMYLDENGPDGLEGYYRETEKVPDGLDTVNRATYQASRRGFRPPKGR